MRTILRLDFIWKGIMMRVTTRLKKMMERP